LLLRLARRFTGSLADAEDLVQGLMLKLLEHRHRLFAVREPRAWLARALYHHFIDLRRADRGRRGLFADDADAQVAESQWYVENASGLTDPEDCAHGGDLRECIALAVGRLPQTQLMAVMLHDLEGCTMAEIGERLQISVHTLKSALTQARRRLREELAVFDPVSPALTKRRLGALRRDPVAAVSPYRRRRHRREGNDTGGSSLRGHEATIDRARTTQPGCDR
jgi:RNA polymerase sigma-70 factor, ECF subfamily